MLTANRLRKLLSYDPATGKFRWRIGVRAGRLAGNIRGREGYYQIGVDRKLYQASRLAWLYMTGKWPNLQIDYINRNRSDTRWANLQLVTPAQKRASARTTSKLGVKGVWITPGGKYAARIKVAGKITYLGSFDTTKEAGAAYAKAAKRAYGKFARER
ncbi:MAG: HNH endonuclease signature motif containing protein [Pseudolabrys sp.]